MISLVASAAAVLLLLLLLPVVVVVIVVVMVVVVVATVELKWLLISGRMFNFLHIETNRLVIFRTVFI